MISVVIIVSALVFRPAALCCSTGPCRVCSRCVQLEVMNYTLILLIYSSTAGFPNQSKQTRLRCKCTCVWIGTNLWWSCFSVAARVPCFCLLSCPDGVCPHPWGISPHRLLPSVGHRWGCYSVWHILSEKFKRVLICGSREPMQWWWWCSLSLVSVVVSQVMVIVMW